MMMPTLRLRSRKNRANKAILSAGQAEIEQNQGRWVLLDQLPQDGARPTPEVR